MHIFCSICKSRPASWLFASGCMFLLFFQLLVFLADLLWVSPTRLLYSATLLKWIWAINPSHSEQEVWNVHLCNWKLQISVNHPSGDFMSPKLCSVNTFNPLWVACFLGTPCKHLGSWQTREDPRKRSVLGGVRGQAHFPLHHQPVWRLFSWTDKATSFSVEDCGCSQNLIPSNTYEVADLFAFGPRY